MSTRHLILGKTTDFLTGQSLADTHDERVRQKIAQLLVNQKGYDKSDILPRQLLHIELEDKTGTVPVDFIISPENKALMMLLFRPGSIVSRRRVAIAAARLFSLKAIPYAAVTNGDDAEIMETSSGKVIGTSLESVFHKNQAGKILENIQPLILSEDRRQKEKQILFAMEVLTRKECDDYTCSI